MYQAQDCDKICIWFQEETLSSQKRLKVFDVQWRRVNMSYSIHARGRGLQWKCLKNGVNWYSTTKISHRRMVNMYMGPVLIIVGLDMFHVIRVGDHMTVAIVIHRPRLMSSICNSAILLRSICNSAIRRSISVVRRSVHRRGLQVITWRGAVQRRSVLQRRSAIDRRRLVLVGAATILGRGEEISSILLAAPDLRVSLHLLRLLQCLKRVHEPVHDHALRLPVHHHALHAPQLHQLLIHLLLALGAAHGHQKLQHRRSTHSAVTAPWVKRCVTTSAVKKTVHDRSITTQSTRPINMNPKLSELGLLETDQLQNWSTIYIDTWEANALFRKDESESLIDWEMP